MQIDRHLNTIVWSYRKRRDNNCLNLVASDISHLIRIYRRYGLAPESMDRIVVEFLLQREDLSRYIIKELDLLLRVGGKFEIVLVESNTHSSYTRSRSQVKYEMSISTDGRYKQTSATRLPGSRLLKLTYEKVARTLPSHDVIDKWSFGIITNGKKPELVERLIVSIERQNIPDFEILVCGPTADYGKRGSFCPLADVVLSDDIRAPICAKKNKIIQAARHNNLCILHDRFYLPDDWYTKMREYGLFFDFLCLPTIDSAGHRFMVDWMTFCDPITQTCARNRSVSYSKWSARQIIQGGAIIGKKHLMAAYMLDERLYWDELEDIHFSKIAYLNGAFFYIDINNNLLSSAVNHTPARHGQLYANFKERLLWWVGLVTDYLRFSKYRRYDGAGW